MGIHSRTLCHHLAVGIEDGVADGGSLPYFLANDFRCNGDITLRRGLHMDAPMCNMHLLRGCQPHMAVDATPAVPPGVGLVAVVHPHSHHIVASAVDVWREVILKRTVAIRTLSEAMSVDIYCRIHIDAVKLNEIAVGITNTEMLAVPPHSAWQCATACSRGVGWGEVTLYRPVVGQVEGPPRSIIVSGLCHLGGVGEDESPSLIKALAVACPGCQG